MKRWTMASELPCWHLWERNSLRYYARKEEA